MSSFFLNAFKPSYLRNNRRGGQKNIRCFPTCAEEGHKCSGFCGRTVHIQLSAGNGERQGTLHAVAEFLQAGTDGLAVDATAKLAVGTVVTKAFLDANTRVKEDPLRRFIGGAPNAEKGTFGFRPSCWHYSWRSNKHCTNKKHSLRVYVFATASNGSGFECVETIDSLPFSLFSSKQLDNYASTGNVPVGAIALFNAKRNRSGNARKRAATQALQEEKTGDDAAAKGRKRRRVTKKRPAVKKQAKAAEAFPYDAMIAECLGLTRIVSLPKEEAADDSWPSPKCVQAMDDVGCLSGMKKHPESTLLFGSADWDVDYALDSLLEPLGAPAAANGGLDFSLVEEAISLDDFFAPAAPIFAL